MTLDEVRDVVGEIKFRDWNLNVSRFQDGEIYLQVQFNEKCNQEQLIDTRQYGRKWHISAYAVRSEIVGTALKAVLTALEHEAREQFLYKGVPIFGPHFDVEQLATMVHERGHNILEVR